MSDAVDVLSGFAFQSAQYSRDRSHSRLLRGINVAPHEIDVSDETFWERKPGDKLEKYELKSGDIVIAMDRPWINAGFRIAVVDSSHLPALLVQRVSRLRAKKHFDQRYIFHQLSEGAFLRHLQVKQTETTVPHVSPRDISTFRIMAPPLPEQKRIAAILDKADEIRKKRAETIRLTEELLKSAFLEMFGDPLTNPKGWPVRKLGEVFDVQLGKMLSQKAKVGKEPLPYLGNRHVQWGRIQLEEVPTMDFDEREQEKFVLRAGDLLVCEGGEVGRTAIWHDEQTTMYYQKALHRLRPKSEAVVPEYMLGYMREAAERGLFVGHTAQTSIAHLTREKLLDLNLMVPEYSQQVNYKRLYGAQRTHLVTHSRAESSVQMLACTLTQRALRGEL